MIDVEKVITAWEIFRDSNPYQICDGKEFRAIKEPEYCMGQMIEDTITLLKTQKTEEPHPWEHIWDGLDYTFKGRCRNCGFIHYFIQWHDAQYRFCPQCGEQKMV